MDQETGELGNNPQLGLGEKEDEESLDEQSDSFEDIGLSQNKSPKNPSLGGASELLDAVAAISSQLEVRAVAQEAAKQIAQFSNADVTAISRWDEEMGVVVLWAEYKRGHGTLSPVPYLPYETSEYPSTEKVLKSSLPLQIQADDPKADEIERLTMEGLKAKSLLMLPLFAQEQVIGLIEIFETKKSRVFTQDEIANVQVLAKHAGISLDRAVLLAETRQHAAELEALRKASLNLTASLEWENVLYAILESALHLSQDALDAHIFLFDEGKLTFGAALWANGSRGKSFAEPREDGLTYNVARSGDVIVVSDFSKHPLFEEKAKGPNGWKGAIIGLPLKVHKRVVGVMNMAYRKPQEFSEETLRSLGLLADQAALAIVNVRLHNFVRQQARTDPLTGLANRRAFDERLDEEIRRSSRYEHPFSLFMMDLDGFKRINDTYGHPTGDQTLRTLGECFSKNVRDTDFIARYGGDEFVMILPETEKTHAEKIARKLIQTVDNYPFSWKSEKDALSLTLTIGIACFPSNADTAKGVIAFADQQLYREKEEKINN